MLLAIVEFKVSAVNNYYEATESRIW